MKDTNKGFTIIEVMIAMAIFTVLVTVGIGAVLEATSKHNRTKNIRSIMDNLSYVMEDMSRNIRLGTDIRCVTSTNESLTVYGQTVAIDPADCFTSPHTSSNKILFRGVNGTNIAYAITPPAPLSGTNPPNEIAKSTDGGLTFVYTTPPEVTIDFDKSGFTVLGALASDSIQPSVVIRLSGTVRYKGVDSDFSLQTTVVPRALDS